MSKLIVRSFKLHPETLAQIQNFSAENGLSFSEAMREAARSLNRSAHSDVLADKLENTNKHISSLEQNISRLIDILSENLERDEARLLFLMDRVQRLYNGSRLISALGEHAMSEKALSTWLEKKAKIIQKFKNEETPK